MCLTSAIYDYGRQNPPWQNPDPRLTQPPPILPDHEAADAIKRFLKMLDAAKDYDDATGQPDCETADKASFIKEVLDRLTSIEDRLSHIESA